MDLPGELVERDEATDWCEMVRARVGEAEVVSSSVNPPVVPMVLLLPLRVLLMPEVEELALEDVEPVLLPPAAAPKVEEEAGLIRRFDAILRSPGLAGDGGSPAATPPSGLLK